MGIFLNIRTHCSEDLAAHLLVYGLLRKSPLVLHELMRYRTIGGMITDRKKFKTREDYMRISVDFTLEAANAFARGLSPHLGDGKRFRFVFCSGMFSEMDQGKSLWFLETSRKAKVGYFLLHYRTLHFSDEKDWI